MKSKNNILLIKLLFTFILIISINALFSQSNSLIAYYKLNGNAYDYSGNKLNGTLNGTTPAKDRFGIPQNAIQLDGKSDYIDLGTNADFAQRTISVWFKADTFTTTGGTVFTTDNSTLKYGSTGFSVLDYSGTNRLNAGVGTNLNTFNGLTKKTWYHYVISVSTSWVKFYLNGKLLDSLSNNNYSHSSNGFKYARLGCNRNGSVFFKGSVDDIRIYNYELSKSEVISLFNEAPNCLFAQYDLDGDAEDNSGNDIDGSLNGTKLANNRFGVSNKAIYFNGTSDYINLGTDADFLERTISVWFKADTFTSTGGSVFTTDNATLNYGATGFSVQYDGSNNKLTAGIGSNWNTYYGLTKSTWYHYVITSSYNWVKFYINGKILDSLPNNNFNKSSNGYQYARLGCNRNGSLFFKGYIDDVKIYKCELSKSQIEDLYNEVPKCLYADYKLDGDAIDNSGNNRNGSLKGTKTIKNRFGDSDKALYFNGTSDYVNLGTAADILPRTISLWFKADTFTTSGGTVFTSDNANLKYGATGFSVLNYNGVNRLNAGVGSNWSIFNGLKKNKWYHYVFVVSNKWIKFYLNGAMLDSLPNNNFNHSYDGLSSARLGCNRNGLVYFKGSIDDVKIYNCDLNYSDVLKLYDYQGCSAEFITQPNNQSVSINGTASFSVNSADNTASYKWQINSGKGFVDFADTGQYSGSQTKNLKISDVSKTKNDNNLFRCIVKNSKCSDTSEIVKLSVLCSSIISTEPSNDTSTNGGKAVLSINSGFSGAKFQWQIYNGIAFKDLSDGGQFSGVTTNTLTIDDLLYSDNSSKFRCIATFDGCIDSSKIALLTVNCNPVIKNQPTGQKIIRGKNVIYEVTAFESGSTYQWQIKNGLTFQNLSDAGQFSGTSTRELNIKNITMSNNSQIFRCVLNYKGCSETSDDASLEVLCDKFISANPVTQTKYIGENAKFIVLTNEPNSTILWQLNNGTGFINLSNAGQYNGVTDDTLIVSNLTLGNDNFKFRCILTLDGCKDTSEIADLLVSCLPIVKTQPYDKTGYTGKNISFEISNNGSKLTRNWQTDFGLGFQNLTNAGQYEGVNTDTLKISNLSTQNDNQKFRCVLSEGSCNDTTKVVKLTVKTTGINNFDKSDIKIYPNPVNNNLFISINDMKYNDVSVKIFNISGQLLFDEKLLSKEMRIDMNNYSNRVYYVKVLSPKAFEIRKIIKE